MTILRPNNELELPFKPFTLSEVSAMTKASGALLDTWIACGAVQPHTHSDVGPAYGLDYVQTFAVYCGVQYLQEGSEDWRATEIVRMLSHCDLRWIESECAHGRTIPVPAEILRQKKINAPSVSYGIMIEGKGLGRLGQRLNTRTLLDQFIAEVARVFPKSILTK